jgi:hypothetical protein
VCCGDLLCDNANGETSCNCRFDCGDCCGDLTCDLTESEFTCPADCAPGCPDGSCDGSETSCDCPADCTATACCGNGLCEGGEDDTSCALDCGCSVAGSCFAGFAPAGCSCDPCAGQLGTACVDAQSACGVPPTSCGNGQCDCLETIGTCSLDCSCGDGSCDFALGEYDQTCADDCGCGAPAAFCGGNGGGTLADGTTLCYCDDCCIVSGDCCVDAMVHCTLTPTCGNGTCEYTESPECENTTTCPEDCNCSNGTCDRGETAATCSECSCGDGRCDEDEAVDPCGICPEDCC